jgi:hypothetical protein
VIYMREDLFLFGDQLSEDFYCQKVLNPSMSFSYFIFITLGLE